MSGNAARGEVHISLFKEGMDELVHAVHSGNSKRAAELKATLINSFESEARSLSRLMDRVMNESF